MNYNQQVLKQYNLSIDDLTDWVRARGVEPLMLVITGSHMWHTATPDSDLDIRGVYLQPTRDFHGLDQPKGTIEANGVLGKDIDIQLYELAHLYRMLLGHNGNVVEMMLSPTVIYEEGIWNRCWRDRPDRSSCNVAELFLTKRLAKYYTGYFHSQRKRAGQNRGGKALVYCVTPGHRVLTDDLRWVPVETLSIGDKIIGFSDDHEVHNGAWRQWKSGEVTYTGTRVEDVCDILLSDGTILTSTAEHRWLCNVDNKYMWRRTDKLQLHTNIKRLLPVWETDNSYESGWLAGFFDGEGSLAHGRMHHPALQVHVTQNEGELLSHVIELLEKRGHIVCVTGENERSTKSVYISRSKREVMRFLGEVRPLRLLKKFNPDRIGSLRGWTSDPNLHVIGVIPRGKREVITLSTSIGTYVCEGFGAHNSYRELMAGTVLMATGRIIYNLDELAFLYDKNYRAVPLLAQYRSDWNVPQGSVELAAFEEDWADMLGIMQRTVDNSVLPDREPTWARDELEYKLRMTRWDDIQVRAFNDRR